MLPARVPAQTGPTGGPDARIVDGSRALIVGGHPAFGLTPTQTDARGSTLNVVLPIFYRLMMTSCPVPSMIESHVAPPFLN